MTSPIPIRIKSLRVCNYRVLQDVWLDNLFPLTVFSGPNGSGKSTIFDVFSFLQESFESGLRNAWRYRGGIQGLRTRGQEGPIIIELTYLEQLDVPPLTYHLAISENRNHPVIVEEWLQWERSFEQKAFRFLDFREGEGYVISGKVPNKDGERAEERLEAPDVLAVSTFGQFAKHPRLSAFRRFVANWHLSDFAIESLNSAQKRGLQERISPTGSNITNVLQYLAEEHPQQLKHITQTLSARVPQLENVNIDTTPDNQLSLKIKDRQFARPIEGNDVSTGTLLMLAYLVLLHTPTQPSLIGIEEPERYFHPQLVVELAAELRQASANSQLMITTHSPYFVNSLLSEELWVLFRNEQGFTQAHRASHIPIVNVMMNEGGQLGDLWMEGYFDVGNPLKNAG